MPLAPLTSPVASFAGGAPSAANWLTRSNKQIVLVNFLCGDNSTVGLIGLVGRAHTFCVGCATITSCSEPVFHLTSPHSTLITCFVLSQTVSATALSRVRHLLVHSVHSSLLITLSLFRRPLLQKRIVATNITPAADFWRLGCSRAAAANRPISCSSHVKQCLLITSRCLN